jgi:ribonuclease P protein component
VAFTFGRAFGPAVQRNRIRRRIRSILTELDREQALPPGLLTIGGRSQLIEHSFDQLQAEITAMITELRRTDGSRR